MSRPFLGYIGNADFTDFSSTTYQGVATLENINTLGNITTPPAPTSLTKPTAYGLFYDDTAVELSDSDLTTGILIDGNAASNPDHAGAYKLHLASSMTLEFHLWGAGGGGSSHGGYTKYVATFDAETDLGLYLPGWNGVPTTTAAKQTAQWPDAGSGGTIVANHGMSGGGSARVGDLYANLAGMNASTATYYAIAGGGGGAHSYADNAGHGGGSSGSAAGAGDYSSTGGSGGTQSAGGAAGAGGSYGGNGVAGAKYQGGDGYGYSSYGGGGGGGGGYYGGGSGATVYAAGGGGSGYINTGFNGYSSGSTTAGTSSGSPAGVGYTKPTDAGDGDKRGAIFFKKQ